MGATLGAFREAEIPFHINFPFKAARQKRQKGLFREMYWAAVDECPLKGNSRIMWGLSMRSLHDIHYKAGLRTNQSGF